MEDKYQDFFALAKTEILDLDYQIRVKERHDAAAVVAIHGGGIEGGTSEVAEAIAADDLSFYAFEGIKVRGNRDLHITSHRFDEPRCIALVTASKGVISIHGENSERPVAFLGGKDTVMQNAIRASLTALGFVVDTHQNRNLQGLDPRNICNRGMNGCGIQLELSLDLRRSFFKSFSVAGRSNKTAQFNLFVAALRKGIM